MTLNTSIGVRISELRKQNNMTQEQLAEKLDISIKHCSSVERGLSCLSLEKLIEVSDFFDVSIDYLVKGIPTCNADIDLLCFLIPQSIKSIISSHDEDEIKLLQEYLKLYTKLRANNK